MDLAVILFLGGAVVIGWIYAWSRQHIEVVNGFDIDQVIRDVPAASSADALLVAQGQGKVIYANESARQWLGMNGGTPHLEQIAQIAQPTNSFLELFAGDYQSSFQLGQRWVEASSHRIPSGSETRTVIVMRELSANTDKPDALNMSLAMALINDIGEMVNASMGVEQALQVLLTIIGQALSFDAGEICLWDAKEQALFQRGWVGDAMYLIALTEAGGRYELGEGITGWVAQYRQPVLLNDREYSTGIVPKLPSNPYQSFISVPLELGERFVGTLEIMGLKPDAYTQGDLALLQAISNPVAVMIYNAEIYAEQSQRIGDLANLQKTITVERTDEADVEPVYAALNQRIATLLSASMSGIFLYDADRKGLVAAPPFYGLPNALISSLYIPLPEDSPQYDIWTLQQSWVSNDLVDEPLVETLGLKPIVEVSGITSTAWVPLQLGGSRIGVLAVSNKQTGGGFTPRDIQNLTVLSAQVAVVIENLRLYQREKRMDTELIGLQEITNAIGALSHETEFYGEITERIAKLMEMEMCGILLYEADTQHLVSQLPFYGVDDDLIADYAIHLTPGSVMEELWNEEKYWISNRVQSDPLVFEADLYDLADKIGVEKTLMVVLYASDRRLGVLQVSNKLNGEDFTDSDARLLMIFATQAAAIIENARLFRAAQRSTEQAQGLRRVAELAGNVLTTQETFSPVLAEISRLMASEIVFVNVINQQTSSLVTYPRWVHGIELSEPIVQDIFSSGFENSVMASHDIFMSNDVLAATRVIDSYKLIATRFNIHNAIVVPLVFGDRTLGELGVANRHGGEYVEADLGIVQAVAAQAAAALDRLLLYEETGQNLSRRLEELDAISRISNELSTTLDLDRVLNVIREEAVRATGAEGSTLALLKPYNAWKYPDVPEMERRLGHTGDMLKLADIELESIMRGADMVLVADYDFISMENEPAIARSAVAAAIMYLDQVVGVIHLYHHQIKHFDDRAATFLMTLAVKAALGYGNSIRYQEQITRGERLRRRVEQLNSIFELGQMVQTSTDPASILEAIAYSVQQSVGFDTVVMVLADESADVFRRVAQAGLPMGAFEQSKSKTITLEDLEQLIQKKYHISGSYFFPIGKVKDWYIESMGALRTSFDGNRTLSPLGKDAWHDGDMFLVPLHGTTGNLLGMMCLDRPHNNLRPDRGTVEVLEIFAHQAASTIENTRLYLSSLSSVEQEARVNEIMEAVAETLDIEDIVKAVSQGLLRILSFNKVIVALRDSENRGFDILRVSVLSDQSVKVEKESVETLDNMALGHTYKHEQDTVYYVDSPKDEDFVDLNRAYKSGERTSLFLPLLTGGECLGAIHIGSDLEDSRQFVEFRPLLKRVVQLVASAVQNARLFNQAVNLQVLNQSVVESIQQGIIVLDSSGRIISANEFMHQRYEWDDDDANGQDLFTYRPQLAEFMAKDLRKIFDDGIPQERINQMDAGDNDDALMVSNFYLYPLKFGDSIRGAVILVEDVTERMLLERAMEARANQLAALTNISSHITASLDRGEVIQLALDEMGWLIPHTAMTLWRRNGSYMVLEGASGLIDDIPDDQEDDFRFLFSDYEHIKSVVTTKHVDEISNVSEASHDFPMHLNVESWMGVPLVNQGHVIGLMMLSSNEVGIYASKSDQNIALAFGSQVAIAEANADLFEQTFERTNELGTLLEAAQATALTTDLDSVFRTVVELMFSVLDMDDCAIMIWHEVDNELEVQVDMNRHGDVDRITPKGARISLSDHPAKMQALHTRDVIVINRDDVDTLFIQELQELTDNGDVARMIVPLVVHERSIGLIQLEQTDDDRDEEAITPQRIRLARALGTQVAVAIENARLSAETIAHFEESLVINDLSQAVSGTLDLNVLMEIVRKQLPGVTDASELYLALYEPETKEITFPLAVKEGEAYEMEPRMFGTDEVSFIIEHRRPLSLGADYFSPDELRKSLGITNGEGDAKSYMGVPLIAGDQVLGVLALRDSERTRAFTVNEHRLLTTVGAQLGAAIQNARLFRQVTNFADELNEQVAERTQELKGERDQLNTLYQITSEVVRMLDRDQLLPHALGMIANAVAAHDGAIIQLDPQMDMPYSSAVLKQEMLQENPDGNYPTHPAEMLARWLIKTGEEIVIVEDLYAVEYWDQEQPGARKYRSALAALLETTDELLGVMVMLSYDVDAFSETHIRLMTAAANQVASAINNAELYKLNREHTARLGVMLQAEQEEAEKNKAILEGIADGVILADANGKIISFNTAAEHIFHISREEAMGQLLSELSGATGNWTQVLSDTSVDFSHQSPSKLIDEQVEINNQVVSIHVSPVFTNEQFLGTVSVFRDITRIIEVDRMKSEFVSNVSHEFRTPLTPIKGYTDLLLMGAAGEVSDQQKTLLDTIKSNVGRLSALVEDVLNISQIDSGREQLNLSEVDMNQLIKKVVDARFSQPHHYNKNFTIEFEVLEDLPLVQGDPDKFVRIFNNLIDNAFNYTQANGTISLGTQLEADGETVVVSITDTGVGIPEDFRENIWRRFERHDDTTLTLDVAGTGLGLSIVKELVEMHGGKVWFESELNVGTTFYIRLPLQQPDYLVSRSTSLAANN